MGNRGGAEKARWGDGWTAAPRLMGPRLPRPRLIGPRLPALGSPALGCRALVEDGIWQECHDTKLRAHHDQYLILVVLVVAVVLVLSVALVACLSGGRN